MARAWQRMLSGRRLDLLNPSPVDIEIEDIAHGLSRVARWNGQTRGDYTFSVLQHSLLVEELLHDMRKKLPIKWHVAALIHDASEYVIGDMISPFKNALGISYREFEDKLQEAIHIRFGLPPETPADIKKLIKKADKKSAWLEATQLAGFSKAEANKYFCTPTKAMEKMIVTPQKPEFVKGQFIERFNTLLKQVK